MEPIAIGDCSSDIDLFSLEPWSDENNPDIRVRFLDDPGTPSTRPYVYCGKRDDLNEWLNNEDNKAYFWVPVDKNRPIGENGENGMPDHNINLYKLPGTQTVYTLSKFIMDNNTSYVGVPITDGLTRVGVERYIVSGIHGQAPGYRVYIVIPYIVFDVGTIINLIRIYSNIFALDVDVPPDRSMSEYITILRDLFKNRPISEYDRQRYLEEDRMIEGPTDIQSVDREEITVKAVMWKPGILFDIDNGYKAIYDGITIQVYYLDRSHIIMDSSVSKMQLNYDGVLFYISNNNLMKFSFGSGSPILLMEDVFTNVFKVYNEYILLDGGVYDSSLETLVSLPFNVDWTWNGVDPILLNYDHDTRINIYNIETEQSSSVEYPELRNIPDGYTFKEFKSMIDYVFIYENFEGKQYIVEINGENGEVNSRYTDRFFRWINGFSVDIEEHNSYTYVKLDDVTIEVHDVNIDLNIKNMNNILIRAGGSIYQLFDRFVENINYETSDVKLMSSSDDGHLLVTHNNNVSRVSDTTVNNMSSMKFISNIHALGIPSFNPNTLVSIYFKPITYEYDRRDNLFTTDERISNYDSINIFQYTKIFIETDNNLYILPENVSYSCVSFSVDHVSGTMYRIDPDDIIYRHLPNGIIQRITTLESLNINDYISIFSINNTTFTIDTSNNIQVFKIRSDYSVTLINVINYDPNITQIRSDYNILIVMSRSECIYYRFNDDGEYYKYNLYFDNGLDKDSMITYNPFNGLFVYSKGQIGHIDIREM